MKYLTGRRALLIALATVAFAEAILLIWPVFRDNSFAQKATPAERGYRVAEKVGCFTCHGPLGKQGIKNPGAAEGEVPAWDGGNYMMYVTAPEEVREWILYGAPKRKLEEDAHQHDSHAARALIDMPAYEGFLSDDDLEDLIAFYNSVAWAKTPPQEAALGRSLARSHGCFSCHGEEGRARQPNPGSLKGYIPSWEGDDFAELVRDDTELRAWIEDGNMARLQGNPAARFFMDRQRIKMPAYGEVLSEEEIDRVIAYIRWLREDGTAN
jgi:mono/diheme cytochrome c family protein